MLNKLIEKLDNNRIIKLNFFENSNINEILDMRDDEEFDFEWMRIYDSLIKLEINDSKKRIIDDIREKSFLMIYNLSKSSEIAGCVSDDFEIICKAYINQYNDIWLNSLIMSYVRGEVPSGVLELTNYSLMECMNKLLGDSKEKNSDVG